MQNYFNYFTEIETRFQARRGSILLLSTLDWALIEAWREAGVPLEAVLRGIDDAFDKYDARLHRAGGRLRKVNGLAWCAQSVMQATEAMREAAIGGDTTAAKEPADSGFEEQRLAAYLTANAQRLVHAGATGAAAGVIGGIAERLRALAAERGTEAAPQPEQLEATLTALESRLFAALTLDASDEEVLALQGQAARELAPYRGKMSAVQLKQVTEQFIHKRLLEARGLPRLSLFYMDVGMNPRIDNEAPRAGRNSGSPEALLQVIVAAQPERIEPRCRHFGACGGCQLQDIPTDAQLAAKRTMLLDVLQRGGLRDLPGVETHAAEPWHYRNRARMRVSGTEIGYSRRASHEFLPVGECPILSPLLWRTATALRELVQSGLARWPASTVSFELFADAEEGALQLAVQLEATVANVDRDAPRDLRVLCEALRTNVPQLAGAGLSVAAVPDPSQSRRVQQSRRVEIARWGEPALDYRVEGRTYRITRNAFFQVNRYLTADMVRTVAGMRSGAIAYDLFAGAGLFSVPLTERFAAVTAVEIGEPAAGDLALHLAACGPQHRSVRSTALDFLQRHTHATAPDLIVLDPPRAGLGLPTVRALLGANAREIVYVSCDAGTFARDARPLVESGYTLASLHLFDLFPQTFHTETIAVFRR